MADIELVIKIPEELYNYMQTERYDEHLDKRFDYKIRFAVKDGVPLPKGHGRLIDADMLKEYARVVEDTYLGILHTVDVKDIDIAPTIIDADKERD